jgi:hypothetical protein
LSSAHDEDALAILTQFEDADEVTPTISVHDVVGDPKLEH